MIHIYLRCFLVAIAVSAVQSIGVYIDRGCFPMDTSLMSRHIGQSWLSPDTSGWKTQFNHEHCADSICRRSNYKFMAVLATSNCTDGYLSSSCVWELECRCGSQLPPTLAPRWRCPHECYHDDTIYEVWCLHGNVTSPNMAVFQVLQLSGESSSSTTSSTTTPLKPSSPSSSSSSPSSSLSSSSISPSSTLPSLPSLTTTTTVSAKSPPPEEPSHVTSVGREEDAGSDARAVVHNQGNTILLIGGLVGAAVLLVLIIIMITSILVFKKIRRRRAKPPVEDPTMAVENPTYASLPSDRHPARGGGVPASSAAEGGVRRGVGELGGAAGGTVAHVTYSVADEKVALHKALVGDADIILSDKGEKPQCP